jgi:hypothetical protein
MGVMDLRTLWPELREELDRLEGKEMVSSDAEAEWAEGEGLVLDGGVGLEKGTEAWFEGQGEREKKYISCLHFCQHLGSFSLKLTFILFRHSAGQPSSHPSSPTLTNILFPSPPFTTTSCQSKNSSCPRRFRALPHPLLSPTTSTFLRTLPRSTRMMEPLPRRCWGNVSGVWWMRMKVEVHSKVHLLLHDSRSLPV